MAQINGEVINSERNMAIPFISVDLMQGATKISDTHTDEEGKFTFTDIPAGEYSIVVMSPIHQPVHQPITVEEDDESLDIRIETVRIHLR